MKLAEILPLIILSHCRTLRRSQNCRFRPYGDEIRVNGAGGSVRWWSTGDDVRDNKGGRWFEQGKVILHHGSKKESYRRVGDFWQTSGGRILRSDSEGMILQYGRNLVEVTRQGDEYFARGIVENQDAVKAPESDSKPRKPITLGTVLTVIIIAVAAYWLRHHL